MCEFHIKMYEVKIKMCEVRIKTCKIQIKLANLKLIIFYFNMKKYIRQCNTHWAWHPQVIRSNQHGTNFQAEVTCLFRTDDKGVTVILFLTKGCRVRCVYAEKF